MAGIDRLTDLTIRAASLEPRVDGTPVRGVGWLETAALMGKLPTAGANVLRALYLHDARALRHTLDMLVVRLSGRPGLSISMQHAIAAASFQALVAMRPCEACGGHGFLHIAESEEMDEHGVWVTTPASNDGCDVCAGEGLSHVDANAVRDMLEVGRDTWDLLVGEPFRDCYRELRHLHEQAVSKFSSRIR